MIQEPKPSVREFHRLCSTLDSRSAFIAASQLGFEDAARIAIQSGGARSRLTLSPPNRSRRSLAGAAGSANGPRMEAVETLFSMWFRSGEWKVGIRADLGRELEDRIGLPPTQRLFSFDALAKNAILHQIYDRIRSKRQQREDLSSLNRSRARVFAAGSRARSSRARPDNCANPKAPRRSGKHLEGATHAGKKPEAS